jgi:Na+-driven multidrug efflux pump
MSMTVSIVRQLLVLLPVAYLLSLTGQLDLVWLAFPIAEIVAVIMCVIFTRRMVKTVIQPLQQAK